MFQYQFIFIYLVLYLLFPLFFSFVRSSTNNDTSPFAHCPKSTCNGFEASYPFWRLDNYNSSTPQYCGYPGFGINCVKNRPHPIINLPGDAFYVKNIDYKNYSLTLVEIDVINVQCPRAQCLKSGENRTYFYVGETEPEDLKWFGICEEKVVATVMERRSFQNDDWIGGFGGAMGGGFVLDWRSASQCGRCEESDGRCGFKF
ncbi:hypothetical protein RND71_017254 [Anisodus tanguticus]|uniref:non-specific serine/threonine protein kinase n=1 Tax=Anisodus tanguticus TaxID=243964 RepID=A0AAE1S3F5_9SOLA|nr:hypothetical protein RND71_017254 [Anisodus tanguticus]